MNYYLVTKAWGDRSDHDLEYWRFDTDDQAAEAEMRLGGLSVDYEPVDRLQVDGTIVGSRDGSELPALEPQLFANNECESHGSVA